MSPAGRRDKRPGRVIVAASLLLWAACLHAAEPFPQLRFSAASIEIEDSRLDGLSIALETDGAFHFAAARLEDPRIDPLQHGLALDGRLGRFEQNAGGLSAGGQARYRELPLDFSVDLGEMVSSLCLETQARTLGELLASMDGLQQAGWARAGEVGACLGYRDEGRDGEALISLDLDLHDIAFDSPEGRYAGEGLALELHGELPGGSLSRASLSGQVLTGAVLFDHLYAEFTASPLRFDVTPQFSADRLAALAFDVADDGALALTGQLQLEDERASTVEIRALSLAFPAAYERYLEPMAAAWTLDGLQVTGGLKWSGALGPDGLRSGDLDLLDLSVVDTERGRFALTGLNTRLRPGAPEFDSTLEWRGLLLRRINLGAGRAHLDSSPGTFALAQPLTLQVLGGALHLQKLAYRLPVGGAAPKAAELELQAEAEGIELERLTAALDWPRFGGTIGGEIPRVHLDDGVLNVDGEIRVDVFGGSIGVSDLAVERLFGVLPSLSANAVMHDLDLELLTGTFEFGSISGRVDGYVRDLRLLDWSPVAFDAWLGTPERQSRSRSISRQAVNHLAAIGGGGATAALAGPVMRLFNSFSYKRLGLGCRLDNYVCEVSGVREEEGGVLLLEGAGIPKVTVRAYNRRVDWPQMVANLVAVSSGESVRVGEGDGP